MKQFLKCAGVTLFAVLLLTALPAQDDQNKLSSISLHVMAPSVNDKVNDVQAASIETKVESIVTESGIASSDYNNSFVIEPKFMVTDIQKSAGGMRKVVVADCSFSLSVKQQNSGAIFSQYAKTIKGSGFSDAEAISNAVSQIDATDEKAIAFIAKAKDKIIAYYKQNCEVLMQKAEKNRQVKEFGQALAILLTIPEEADGCYAKAQAKAVTVFKEFQNLECKKYLQQAQAYAAAKDFDNALQTLSWIDPTGVCISEAKSLIKKIDTETSADKKKQWEYVFKAIDGTIEVAKARSAAMNNLTLYMLKQPSKTILVN